MRPASIWGYVRAAPAKGQPKAPLAIRSSLFLAAYIITILMLTNDDGTWVWGFQMGQTQTDLLERKGAGFEILKE